MPPRYRGLDLTQPFFAARMEKPAHVEEVRRGRRRANTQDGSSASELRLGKPIVIECGLVRVVAQSALADAKPARQPMLDHKNKTPPAVKQRGAFGKTKNYFPTRPVSPSFCNAVKTSLSLKSPVTVNDLAPLAAVLAFTPATEPSESFTAVTHLAQQRCTPST